MNSHWIGDVLFLHSSFQNAFWNTNSVLIHTRSNRKKKKYFLRRLKDVKQRFFLCVALTRFQAMISAYGALRSYSLDTITSVGLLWTSDQPPQRPLPDNTQQSQQKDIHAPGGNGNRNSSERAAAGPRGHWVRQNVDMLTDIRQQTIITWRNWQK